METVILPLEKVATQSVISAECPECGYPRRVEPDANYTVTCEGCGEVFRIRSPI